MDRATRQDRDAQIVAKYRRQASSLADVGAVFGVSSATVRRALLVSGFEIDRRSVQTKTKRNAAVRAARRRGRSFGEIARRFGISRARAWQLCREVSR